MNQLYRAPVVHDKFISATLPFNKFKRHPLTWRLIHFINDFIQYTTDNLCGLSLTCFFFIVIGTKMFMELKTVFATFKHCFPPVFFGQNNTHRTYIMTIVNKNTTTITVTFQNT